MKEIIHKLNIFISDNQKYKLIMLLILLSFGVILEIFGLGILVPVNNNNFGTGFCGTKSINKKNL